MQFAVPANRRVKIKRNIDEYLDQHWEQKKQLNINDANCSGSILNNPQLSRKESVGTVDPRKNAEKLDYNTVEISWNT